MVKAACTGLALFLFAGMASAQIPSANIFFGFSYENTNTSTFGSNLITSTATRHNLNGWEGSFEGKIFPFIGIVGDVAAHYGTESFTELTPNGPQNISVTGHEQEYMVGPRLSVPIGNFRPFGEVEIGAAHIHAGGTLPSPSNTSFATALGGGLDYRLFGPLGLRAEGDYLRTSFFDAKQNNFRLAVGAVLRF